MIGRSLLTIGLILMFLGCAAGRADQTNVTLKFSFKKNHPLVYSIKDKITINEQVSGPDSAGGKKAFNLKVFVELGWKMRLTPREAEAGGSWLVHYQPFDYSWQSEIFTPEKHAVVSVGDNLAVKVTDNGKVTIDTANGLGRMAAEGFKDHLWRHMLSGDLGIRPDGIISRAEGDLPFVDYWCRVNQSAGLFDLTFPREPILPGRSWSVPVVRSRLEGVMAAPQDVVLSNVFLLDPPRNVPAAGGACVGLSQAWNGRDLTTGVELMGRETDYHFSEMDINTSGLFQFDCLRYRLASANLSISLAGVCDMEMFHARLRGNLHADLDERIELLSGEQ